MNLDISFDNESIYIENENIENENIDMKESNNLSSNSKETINHDLNLKNNVKVIKNTNNFNSEIQNIIN